MTSGGQGYAVGVSIACALLPPDVAIGTRCEVETFGEWIGACVTTEPPYDPKGDSIRA
jgi:glycine cleavage system aminomethyltransferase T